MFTSLHVDVEKKKDSKMVNSLYLPLSWPLKVFTSSQSSDHFLIRRRCIWTSEKKVLDENLKLKADQASWWRLQLVSMLLSRMADLLLLIFNNKCRLSDHPNLFYMGRFQPKLEITLKQWSSHFNMLPNIVIKSILLNASLAKRWRT